MGKVNVPKGFDPKFVKHWYLVANRFEAVVYEGQLGAEFRFRKRLKNPEGKLTEQEFGASRPGQAYASSASGVTHAFMPHTEHSEVVAVKFASRIARMLDRAALAEEFTDLVILAEPHFLGHLHKALSKRVTAIVRQEVVREWAKGSDGELERFLQKKLA